MRLPSPQIESIRLEFAITGRFCQYGDVVIATFLTDLSVA